MTARAPVNVTSNPTAASILYRNANNLTNRGCNAIRPGALRNSWFISYAIWFYRNQRPSLILWYTPRYRLQLVTPAIFHFFVVKGLRPRPITQRKCTFFPRSSIIAVLVCRRVDGPLSRCRMPLRIQDGGRCNVRWQMHIAHCVHLL